MIFHILKSRCCWWFNIWNFIMKSAMDLNVSIKHARALGTMSRTLWRCRRSVKPWKMPPLFCRRTIRWTPQVTPQFYISYMTDLFCRNCLKRVACPQKPMLLDLWDSNWLCFISFLVVARVNPTVKFQLGLEVNVIVKEIFKQDEPAIIFTDQEISIKHG